MMEGDQGDGGIELQTPAQGGQPYHCRHTAEINGENQYAKAEFMRMPPVGRH